MAPPRLELHVWDAAFGLESIDAECLAAVAYFTQAFPRERWSEWSVIPSSDPSVCPSHRLPALHHNGTWTSGYHHIVTYLGRHAALELDSNAPGTSPDAFAYETYLSSRAGALVDLSLYASETNWAAATRPAYSHVLRFPLTWTIPAALRADALKRVARYGFSDMDADGVQEEDDEVPAAFRWKGLRRRKGVLESMTPEQMVGIRLCAFAKDTLEVIQSCVEKLGDVSEGRPLCSTSCLVYACLALMIQPEVPRIWLRRLIESEFPKLLEFFNGVHGRITSMKADIPRSCHDLTVARLAVRFFHNVIQTVPAVGSFYAQEWRRRVSEKKTGFDRRTTMILSGLVFAGAALGYGYHLYQGLPRFGRRIQLFTADRKRSGLDQFGEIGDILNMAMGGMREQPRPSRNATSVVDFGAPEHHVVADVEVELHARSRSSTEVD